MAPLLAVTGLRAGYGGVEVLRGVDLEIRAGEIVAVLGGNGAGKSTLNNTLSGIVHAHAGRVTFDGCDITHAGSAAIVAAGLIQVPEGRRVFPDLTVRDNLLVGGYRRGRAQRAQTLDRVYAVFPRLAERQRQRAGTLSGGEQQMLAIGRGMMAQPRLLILDEPSLGLSPKLVDEMFALVRRLHADGLSILLVEQNVAETLSVADRGYVLENGAIRLAGAAADLAADPDVRRAYLGL
ncbi:MAG: ABC transporter ATP-binding protein [Burkholderiales bacterium]